MRWLACTPAIGIVFLALAQEAKFSTTTNLVIVNVSVKDRTGKPLKGLKKVDFTLLEDDKAQAVAIFEEQKLSGEPLPPVADTPGTTEETIQASAPPATASPVSRYQDKRLVGCCSIFRRWAYPRNCAHRKPRSILSRNK